MPAPFLALITPIGGGGDGPPLGTWGGAGQPFPTPPIVVPPGGAYPPGGGGGGGSPGSPQHPIYIPGLGIWSGPWYPLGTWGGGNVPFPTPPMAPGGPPLGTWGGVGQPYPDAGLPGPQPGGPVHIWGGPFQPPYPSQGPGFPTHPIVLPPDLPPTLPEPDNRPIEWKTAWTPQTGWVVVGVPTGPAPTPSA